MSALILYGLVEPGAPALRKHNFNSFRAIGLAALASFEKGYRTRFAILSRAGSRAAQACSGDRKDICSNVAAMMCIVLLTASLAIHTWVQPKKKGELEMIV